MRLFPLFSLTATLFGASSLSAQTTPPVNPNPMHIAPAPLYRDPMTDGPADPLIIYNTQKKEWWMFYSQRRAQLELPNVSFCYGTDVGIATSRDNGKTWVYKGTPKLAIEEGTNTFWAPEVLFDGKEYHMFVTYIQGVRSDWGGASRTAHHTSSDLWNWKFQDFASFDSPEVIDISIIQMPDKTWRVWYKDQQNGGSISTSTSPDLIHWKRDAKPAIPGGAQEGPNVFRFNNHYWMITDEWRGQRVFRSDDAINWEKQGLVLDVPGTRPQDTPQGAHADVEVANGHAYIFYFTHPGRKSHFDATMGANGVYPYDHRRSLIQVADLREENGTLTCDRNAPFDFYLPNK